MTRKRRTFTEAFKAKVTVTFVLDGRGDTLDGERYTLHPTWYNDWLDLDILASINRIIAKSGKEFVCASDVNYAVVFVLDGESKRRLAAERRFPFITLVAPSAAQ